MTRRLTLFVVAVFTFLSAFSQAPRKPGSSEIYEDIKKLNFLGSVLYLAAHPDDENTRLISYFANNVHARTAYLSITRGDGGQNLIGPEIRELLGVIRTNELLKARQTDGGEQFFTRANDFGYSKHPDETLRLWNKEEVLKDVVKVIREFQPDLIINRFDAESAGRTHGHHTSSAILSLEAFDLAADTNYESYGLNAWKTQRVFFNTHWWFYGSREKFEEVDKSEMIAFDTGVYYPTLGLSNSEISSLSRSMHKSQGFGSTGTRGEEMEYIELLKGQIPVDRQNVFEGVDTSWSRVKGGEEIKVLLQKVQNEYDFSDPSKSIPDLIKAYEMIGSLEDSHWKTQKLPQIKDLIAACSGLYLEAVASQEYATKNQIVNLELEAVNRSSQPMILRSVTLLPQDNKVDLKIDLKNNMSYERQIEISIGDNAELTSPYWLEERGGLGMYEVKDTINIGRPLAFRSHQVVFQLEIEGVAIDYTRPVVFKYNDPVKGEVYQPFEILPDLVSGIASKVIIFSDGAAKEIPVLLKSFRDDVKGTVELEAPEGWEVSPQKKEFKIEKKGEDLTLNFTVRPSSEQSQGFIKPVISVNGKKFTKSLVEINYDHIPKQSVLLPSESKVVRLNILKKGQLIGYVKGAGDEVPKYLKQIGYSITEISPEQISERSLDKFDAVIMGIRAYNTVPELEAKQKHILDYVKNGGNLIVQYNTSHNLVVKENLAPYSLTLSRDRITDETAEVTFLNKGHEVLNYPNTIKKEDFDGWVQERGLYFPNQWSEEFTPVLSFKENGDDAMNGSLLVAKYGKGHYIYTGLSFFRELPAGVPGAYKLFANMISVGKNDLEQEIKE
ncbi:PIG-L family deacetylase [Lutimonas zeaxanthinifaciens]|uniref:PIG-L family deacetylase n=1 Tax=Lutimonas zeaxanthinifaciens TaxID=3060215 RepID=UPI00265CE3EB|nr:PIG-L family deacetylase [Lutimonas sp. YSD2104]WKK66844.1 PIG-L family deacetylase [Lutimonas sp. YSD2104]